MIRRPPRSTLSSSSAASDVYKRQPLELADIEFDDLSLNGWAPQPYQPVYRRVMRGIFDPDYFGLKKSADPPAIMLTTKDADPITHFAIKKTSNGESLVTISSPKPLESNIFNGVFKNCLLYTSPS